MSASPAPSPWVRVEQQWQVTPTALAPDAKGVWYVRQDGETGMVGHIAAREERPREGRAGPAPIGVALGPEEHLYVLEGMPDVGSPGRTNVVERLDPSTFEVLASTSVPAIPTALAVAGGKVWVGGTRGALTAFDPDTLKPAWSGTFPGRGASALAAGERELWFVTGSVEQQQFFAFAVDPAAPAVGPPVTVPGAGSGAVAAAANGAWIATPQDNARSLLYPVSAEWTVGDGLSTPSIASMAARDDRVLWLTVDGSVSWADSLGARGTPVPVGDGGVAVAWSGDRIWAAAPGLALLAP
jgi:hypothetical protein